MAAKMLKLKNAIDFGGNDDNDNDYTSDEMIYSDEMQSDDDDDNASHTGNNSKRLQSYQANARGSLFRNRSKLTTRESTRSTRSSSSIKRMPTRKPDPKISNRNAIMARENRRKKKEHMEVLQKTVDDAQNENKKLRKMLSIRNHTISKLTQESLYLRSILANKTEIMSLLRCIQGAPAHTPPITSSVLSFVADGHDYRYDATMKPMSVQKRRNSSGISIGTSSSSSISLSSGCSPASSMSPASYIDDDKENGTVWTTAYSDPFLSSSFTEQINHFISTDLEFDHSVEGSGIHNDINEFTPSTENTDDFQWEHLLSDPTFKSDLSPLKISDIRDIDDSEILSTNSSNTVNIEHNYFNNPITNTNNKKVAENNDRSATTTTTTTTIAAAAAAAVAASSTKTTTSGAMAPGVCLHVSNGRVSLEFCATCHQNSQNAWCEEM